MNLFDSLTRISFREYPCPHCDATVPIKVMTEIESNDDLTEFFSDDINRAKCPGCDIWMQAPEVVTVNYPFGDEFVLHFQCIPYDMLDDPDMLDAYIKNNEAGIKTVFTHDELTRTILAQLRVQLRDYPWLWSPENPEVSRFVT